MNADQSARETPTGRTTKNIAYALIGIYGCGLLGIGAVAAILELLGLASGTWFELLKSGFLILGGALSTVIGYFFGSRGIQEAEANAMHAEERAQVAEKELDNERTERRRLQEAEAPTSGEGDLIVPELYTDPEQN